MFPLSDDNSDRHITPWVNYIFIAANILVFVLLQGFGNNDHFTNAFSVVPQEILSGQDIAGRVPLKDSATGQTLGVIELFETPVSVYLTLFSSMFMHGGIAHIGGNMLYLWIFGDNLEDLMGHLRYFIFYTLCGVVASLAHVFCSLAGNANLLIPSLGASGAISAVMGGYVLLFPKRRVTVIFLRQIMHVPAYAALGSWIFFQLLESSGLLGSSAETGGVAYAAHIGGFIAGLCLVYVFVDRKELARRRAL